MAYKRTAIPFFELANSAYASATVAFFAVDNTTNERLTTLISLYNGISGTSPASNPYTLDSEGKFSSPVYAENRFIAVITNVDGSVQDTGIWAPALSDADVQAAAASAAAAQLSETESAASAASALSSKNAAALSETAAASSASAANASAIAADASADSAESALGVMGLSWDYDTTTSMADPGTGKIRFDTTTFSSMTNMAISGLSNDTGNPDVSDFIASWDQSSTLANRGTIQIRKRGTPATYMTLRLTGDVTDNGAWLQLPVAWISGAGALSASDDLYLAFARTGDAGGGQVAITSSDTTLKYLQSAIADGSGIDTTVLNPGGAEQLQFSVDLQELEEFLALAGKLTGTLNTGTAAMTANRRYRIDGTATYTMPTYTAGQWNIVEFQLGSGETATIGRNSQTIDGDASDDTASGDAADANAIILYTCTGAGAVTSTLIGSTPI